ncbi:putative ribonuclease H-like domain-containing protein [Tanacetum coccineum]
MTHPHPKGNFVPKAVLMKSGIKTLNTAGQNFSKAAVSVNTTRPINTAYTRPTVNSAGKASNGDVTTAGPKIVVSNNKGNEANDIKASTLDLKQHTGNKSYLSDNEEIDGGFVAFGGDPKGGRITGKGKISTDASNISMNYKPVVTENQTNGNAGTKKKTFDGVDCSLKDSPDAGFKPSGEEEKIDSEHQENEDSEVPNTEEPRVNQEARIQMSTNARHTIILVRPTLSAADIGNNVVDEDIVYGCIGDPNMPNFEEIIYSDDDEEVGAEADMNNLATTMHVSPIPTTRVHKDHPLEQIIGDIHLLPQTRRMTKNVTEHIEPKKKVWTLVELPYGKRAIGTKWVYKNKKDDRVARIEAIRLFLAYASFMNFIVYQMDVKSAFLYGTIEEVVYVCQPPGAWYETLSTYLLENGFRRGTIDKTLFIKKDKDDAQEILDKFYGGAHFLLRVAASTPMETNKALLKDEEAVDVDVHLYRSIIRSLMYLTASRPDIMFAVCVCARDSPSDLEAFSNSDYAGPSLDRKSTTGGCQFLGRRLISWQCKK